MNERIKELEPQCWEHNEFGLNFNYEKYAELIVRECEKVSLKSSHRDDDMGAIIARQIKEHFSIE
jgi:hypothetical protein